MLIQKSDQVPRVERLVRSSASRTEVLGATDCSNTSLRKIRICGPIVVPKTDLIAGSHPQHLLYSYPAMVERLIKGRPLYTGRRHEMHPSSDAAFRSSPIIDFTGYRHIETTEPTCVAVAMAQPP